MEEQAGFIQGRQMMKNIADVETAGASLSAVAHNRAAMIFVRLCGGVSVARACISVACARNGRISYVAYLGIESMLQRLLALVETRARLPASLCGLSRSKARVPLEPASLRDSDGPFHPGDQVGTPPRVRSAHMRMISPSYLVTSGAKALPLLHCSTIIRRCLVWH